MTAKDLKNALLQEAVQGKLVPQIASEGNARDLLGEIRKERLSHGLDFANAKSGKKSKKETALAGSNPCAIPEDEIPFDIPESWCWCRLGEVFQTTSGTTPQSKNPLYYDNGTIGWVRTTDLNNGILSEAEILITEKAKSDCNLKMIPTNSVCMALYGGGGTIGKNALLNFETTINQSVCALLPNKFADMKYLQFFLQWQKPHWMDYASGSRKDPNINQIIVKNCPFPIPPLAEQKRIVAAIEKFMPLIEEYGKKETVLNQLNAQIGTLTKKAILQEAVQGKLVPQIPAEGNAKDLLEQIKAQKATLIKEGKIKKEKPLPEITEDEIPFDIPENWCWCRLGEICKFLSRGKSPKYSEIKKYPVFAQKCNLKDGEISLDQEQVLDPEVLPKWKEEYKIQDGDVLVNSTGTGTVMRTRYFKSEYLGNYPFVVPDSHVTVIRTFPEIDSKYIFYCCFGFTVQKYWEENLAGSTNQKELYIGVVGNTPIPLPPLSEQKRIVEAIEKMLPMCEKLGK